MKIGLKTMKIGLKTAAVLALARTAAPLRADADATLARDLPRPVYAIVLSPETAAEPSWRAVADALAEKHRDETWTAVFTVAPTNAAAALRAVQPRYVAFVLRPDEVDEPTFLALKRLMRALDDDPYDDAFYGLVTGPDAATALRIARSRAPEAPERLLATTGVDANVVPGPVAVLSDAFPKGEWWEKAADGTIVRASSTQSLSPVFAEAWRRLDPDVVLTSAHATERNLEMPFSQGAILAKGGRFYATAWPPAAGDEPVPLAAPAREKVWLAAGNCLIANHVAADDMVMTALSFGKVNQFVGYFKPTWFGFVGWTTWRLFADGERSLVESYFEANERLLRKLATGDWADAREKAGLEWDRDATIFYGDPRVNVRLPGAAARRPK